MDQAVTVVRETRENDVARLRADYARALRQSERDPAVFRARVDAFMKATRLDAGPEGFATAARSVQFVHRGCDGRGCVKCTGRGWHSGAKPLAGA